MNVFFLVVFFIPWMAFSQDDFDTEGLEDVTLTEETTTKSWPRFFRNINGSVGHASIFGTSESYRDYSHARLGLQYSLFNGNKIALQGLFERTTIEFMQVADERSFFEEEGIEEDGPRPTPRSTKEKKLEYNRSGFRTEEAYISQDLFDNLSISYGIQQIVWGQFSPYSPTNIPFPFNLSTTDVEFTKVKGTLPQEAGVVNFYPMDNMSLSLYYFPELTYDKVVKKRLDSSSIPLRLPEDPAQTGLRLMFYPSWGTWGLSYYNGYRTSMGFEEKKIICRDSNSCGETSTLTFAPEEMFGVELALPVGNWVHKIELSSTKTKAPLSFHGDLSDTESLTYLTHLERRFLDKVQAENKGELSYMTRQNILAIGTTADLERWYLNLMLFYFDIQEDSSVKEIVELEKKIQPPQEERYDGPIFPGAVISRYLDADKTSEIGVALGIIGNGAGGALFYKKVTDSLVYGAGIQAIEYFSDMAITETGTDDGYKKKDDITTGLLVSLTYKF